MHVTIPDPDDPFGSPAYDGDAFDAGTVLYPGTYPATWEWEGTTLTALVTVHPGEHPTAETEATVAYDYTRGPSTARTSARIVMDREGYVSVNCTRCGVQLVDDDRAEGFYDAGSSDGAPHVCPVRLARAADRLRQVAEAAEAAMWTTVAAAYPEVTAGDLDPLRADDLSRAVRGAITAWIASNTAP